MKLPGPDHPITLTPTPQRVRVTLGGVVVAESTRALTLQEASYQPVQYIPREDAAMALLHPSPRRTHCPYKGDASYYAIEAGGQRAENAVWSYEDPFPAMEAIRGYLAFYRERVELIALG